VSAAVKAVLKVFLAAGIVWLVYFLRGNVYFRLYPAVMCTFALAAFVVSSFKTPMVEVFARRRHAHLDAGQIRYCRKVNGCWIVFLSLHLAVTVASVFMPIGFWAFYNGFFAYLLFAAMFLGEWLVRRKKKGSWK
jgi:uncharacterized membrane protein